MPATDQELKDAQLRLLDAETEVARAKLTSEISGLVVAILNDKHAGSGRSVPAAVTEAIAVWKAVSAEIRKPDFWGAP